MPNELRGPHFDMPVSPAAAGALAQLQAKPELDFRDVAKTAKQVPILRTMVLRAANAASNGLQHSITTPEHAMAMLGSAKLREIVDELCQRDQVLRATTIRARRRKRVDSE